MFISRIYSKYKSKSRNSSRNENNSDTANLKISRSLSNSSNSCNSPSDTPTSSLNSSDTQNSLSLNQSDQLSYDEILNNQILMLMRNVGKFKVRLQNGKDATMTYSIDDFHKKFSRSTYIGHGCTGVVHKYVMPNGFNIAIKECTIPNDKKLRDRLYRELHCASTLEHPAIVRSYGYFIEPSRIFLCMELMTTCTQKLLKRLERIPDKPLSCITYDVVSALDYLKEYRKVVHRDIRPSNILLNLAGQAKLCDFGVAGFIINSIVQSMGIEVQKYISPERISAHSTTYGAESDVWSLGITLFELANGSIESDCLSLFEDSEQSDVPILHPNPKKQLQRDTCNFINSCLRIKPNERPKFYELLKHPFVIKYLDEKKDFMSEWVGEALLSE